MRTFLYISLIVIGALWMGVFGIVFFASLFGSYRFDFWEFILELLLVCVPSFICWGFALVIKDSIEMLEQNNKIIEQNYKIAEQNHKLLRALNIDDEPLKVGYSLSALAAKAQKTEKTADGQWICPDCGSHNPTNQRTCKDCGHQM